MGEKKKPGMGFLLRSLLLVSLLGFSAQADTHRCSLCRMHVKDDSKTHFEASSEGKTEHLCSFICAKHFRKRFKDWKFFVHDYETLKKLPVDSAFFVVKSHQLESELAFGMPPAVVGFESESKAKELQVRLKDGKIVKGFENVENAYR